MKTTVKEFSPREAYASYMLGSVLVDVRDPKDVACKSVDVKQLVNVPFTELDKHLDELPHNRTVVFLSKVGNKSKEAARFLAAHGFEDVATMDGGLQAWEEEGLPVR